MSGFHLESAPDILIRLSGPLGLLLTVRDAIEAREGRREGRGGEEIPGASMTHLIGALEPLPAIWHIFGMETLLFSQLYQPENTQSWCLGREGRGNSMTLRAEETNVEKEDHKSFRGSIQRQHWVLNVSPRYFLYLWFP